MNDMSKYKIEIEIYEGEGGQIRKQGDEVICAAVLTANFNELRIFAHVCRQA